MAGLKEDFTGLFDKYHTIINTFKIIFEKYLFSF